MNSIVVFIALFGTLAQAWRWPWEKPDTPEWSALSVTFAKFNGLPVDVNTAKAAGWTLNRPCGDSNYFAGNRYVLNGDTAVMLLFDFNGKIAGIQNGILKSAIGDLKAPWISDGNMHVITAYFTNPANICRGSRPSSEYIGDQLFLQTGAQSSNTVSIPFKQEDLAGTKWVRGGCFPAWVAIIGFGWVTAGNAESPRYEHPNPNYLKWGFFLSATRPKCIPSLKALTTQHVYLDKRPYLNLCFI
ncbi:hypothetical protein OS493_020963 [Desmophyllum pertusum]|uniref:Uncharacterized protein n=1 Tax=Desmophyllum pertusum TaxID=174260 RepID=A0A9X0D9V4_9CNID|nr:hypothetical protein OS493_020963 [Desmophyllum pertusum]